MLRNMNILTNFNKVKDISILITNIMYSCCFLNLVSSKNNKLLRVGVN